MSSPLTEKSINLNCLIFPSVYVPLKIVIFSSGGVTNRYPISLIFIFIINCKVVNHHFILG